MTIEDITNDPSPLRRPEVQGLEPRRAPSRPGADAEGVQFASLLEKLQRIRVEGSKAGKTSDAPATDTQSNTSGEAPSAGNHVDPLDELSEAMRRAGDAHETAMDIKRRLEESFRRATGN